MYYLSMISGTHCSGKMNNFQVYDQSIILHIMFDKRKNCYNLLKKNYIYLLFFLSKDINRFFKFAEKL